MSNPTQCHSAEVLESRLGDPASADSTIPWSTALALDEAETFPEQFLQPLMDVGIHEYAIPAQLGGKLRSFEELHYITKAIARRDMVVANVLGTTLLGSVFTWLSGSPAQQARLATLVRGRGLAALALTEEAHGGDTTASEVEARLVPGGYELTGTKWLINNCTRARALTVLAAVGTGDERELGLFLVEKSQLTPQRHAYLPKIRTLGVRGLDVAGIAFDRQFILEEARIGSLSSGMGTLMRGLYLTRTLCGALSLGTADTALRMTLRFARRRAIFGSTVFELPEARGRLVGAFVDLLMAECIALTALRVAHVVPEQVSVSSAVVKYLVPTTTEAAVRELSVVLGARHYLRDGEYGIFQKMLRDGLVVSLFDGSTAVNLYVIGLQLAALARGRLRGAALPGPSEALFSLHSPVPEFEPNELRVHSDGSDLVVEGFEAAVGKIADEPGTVAAEIALHARALAQELNSHAQATLASARALRLNPGDAARSPERFTLARRYALLHGAAAATQLWLHNRQQLGEFFAEGTWLALGLARCRSALGHPVPASPAAWQQAVAKELARRDDQALMFGVIPTRLAARVASPPSA